LFSSTRVNSELWSSRLYVAVPIHCEVKPSQFVKL
jgi:hypothetical protein